MMVVNFFQSKKGNEPAREYLRSLEKSERAEVAKDLWAIRTNGLSANVNLRQVRGQLWEIKSGQHRLFYVVISGPTMVILHGCKKQGQQARQQDINVALERMKEVLNG